MINKEFVDTKIIPIIEEKGKPIDVLLIQNIFENNEKDLIAELRTYQNEDNGLGHALEPDIRMPYSSVAATNHGLVILEQIKNKKLKEEFCSELVTYYESVYNVELERFLMVDEKVEEFPHAVWWTYKDIEKNFVFGNPDPEVIGFLYQYRKYVKKLDVNGLINKVIDFVNSKEFEKAEMHILLSISRFYKRVDGDIKNLIKDRLIRQISIQIQKEIDNWDGYSFEPYKVYVIAYDLLGGSQIELNNNLQHILNKVENLDVEVTWKWYLYEDEFEKVKNDWLGYIYFEMIKALRLHREI